LCIVFYARVWECEYVNNTTSATWQIAGIGREKCKTDRKKERESKQNNADMGGGAREREGGTEGGRGEDEKK